MAAGTAVHWGCGNQCGCPACQFTKALNPPLTKWQLLINDQKEQLKGKMKKQQESVWTNLNVLSGPAYFHQTVIKRKLLEADANVILLASLVSSCFSREVRKKERERTQKLAQGQQQEPKSL